MQSRLGAVRQAGWLGKNLGKILVDFLPKPSFPCLTLPSWNMMAIQGVTSKQATFRNPRTGLRSQGSWVRSPPAAPIWHLAILFFRIWRRCTALALQSSFFLSLPYQSRFCCVLLTTSCLHVSVVYQIILESIAHNYRLCVAFCTVSAKIARLYCTVELMLSFDATVLTISQRMDRRCCNKLTGQ